MWAKPITLENEHVRLELTDHSHAADLAEAAARDNLYKVWYTIIPAPEAIGVEIDRRLGLMESGWMVPFTVIRKTDQKAVGMTTWMNIDHTQKRLEIGHTWYSTAVQRTAINTAAKLLLLTQAFDALDAIAVEFRTHSMNRQSRLGIERLGAKLDGVMRSHMTMPNGTLRDTAVYSIIASEWPTAKANLEWQLTKPRP